MTFRPELVAKILAGEKTQTRRLDLARTREDPPRCRYVVGRDYAIQPGRGKAAVGRLLVLEVKLQRLFDMTHEEAIAEGFVNLYAFQRYWHELHGSIDLEEIVWAITFEVSSRPFGCASCLAGAEHAIGTACSEVNPLTIDDPPSSSTRRFGSRTPR